MYGQTAIIVKDLSSKEYPAIAQVNRKRRVNGQREISISFVYAEINEDFISKIEFGWKILFDGEWYTITNPGYAADGDYISVGITAVLSFFVDLNGFYMQDKVEDKSFTPGAYFETLFQGTGYNFFLVSNLLSNTFSYQDNQSKTERFLYGIDRFNCEYIVRGNNVYIYDQIGSDKDVMLHEDLNIKSVNVNVDASGFHTWAKGYGDLPESDGVEEPEYQLEVEYESPLIAKYGRIEGPAIKDGNYKDSESLTAAVRNQVENSYNVSTEIDAVDLTNNGYPEYVLDEGDRVWLYVSKLNLNQQVRVMEVDETFDWEGNRVDVKYVLGNEGIASRYKTQQYDTLKDFQDILNGKKKIQADWLPDAILRASDIINGNQDSLFRYLPGEIIGINQNDPNGYMRFNTDGIGFSRDGGKTYRSAITYEGIVADAITVGAIRGIDIYGSQFRSSDGLTNLEIIGGNVRLTRSNGQYVNVNPDGLFGYNSDESQRFRVDRLLVTSAALGTSNSNVYLAPDANNEARIVDVNSIPSDGVAENYSYRPIRAQGLRFGPGFNGYIGVDVGRELRITSSGFTQDDGSVVYRNLRAAVIYGFGFSTNSTNAYIGSDDETRFVNKGYVDGSSNDPIYRNVRGYKGFFDGIGNNAGNNLYLGVNSEVYVTSLGMTNNNPIVWRPLRAEGFKGDYLEINPSTNSTHIYARPSSDGSLRVTRTGTTDSFRPVEASAFDQSSSYTYKTDITPMNRSGRDVVDSLQVQEFYFNWDYEKSNHQIGLIAEWSEQVAAEDFKSINTSKLLMYVLKNTQENNDEIRNIIYNNEIIVSEIDELKAEIANLKVELDELKGVE